MSLTRLSLFVLVVMILFSSPSFLPAVKEAPDLPWSGISTPGSDPVPFAPAEIIFPGDRLHGFFTFSPDGGRICWPVIRRQGRRPRGIILEMRRQGGKWTGPHEVSLPGFLFPQAPVFGPHGCLYFQARRPAGPGSLDICRSVPWEKGWKNSEVLRGSPNSSGLEGQPSFTGSGDMYLAVSMPGSGWNRGIAVARRKRNGWSEPRLLPMPVNSPSIDAYPFVSPGEDFLLFCSNRGGSTEADLRLMVSFRNPDGSWQEPLNLSRALGIDAVIRFPALSSDGAFLFFQKGNRVFWVDAAVIRSLQGK